MATKLLMRHPINCTEKQFWTHVFDNEDFNEQMYRDEFGFGYELVSRNDGKRRALIKPVGNAPAVVAKALGDGSFFEVGSLDSEQCYRFVIEPTTLKDKVDIHGKMTTESRDGGCTRVVELSISVKIFGIGKVVESFIENRTRGDYDRSAAFTDRFVADKITSD